MILESLLGYKSVWRVLALFAEAPRSEIGKPLLRETTKLGNQAIDNALQRLVSAGVLLPLGTGRVSYRLDLDDPLTKQLLILVDAERRSLRNLDTPVRLVLAELLRKLFDEYASFSAAYLFGSHAAGTARATSDIDVALIFSEKPSEHGLAAIVDTLNMQFGVRLQVHSFTPQEISTSALGKQVLKTGIALHRLAG